MNADRQQSKDKLYEYKKRVDSKLQRIAEDELVSTSNKKLLNDFLKYLEAQGMTDVRKLFYLNNLHALTNMLNKEWGKVKREDIEELMRQVHARDWSDWTKRDAVIALKFFFKWVKGTSGKDYPEEVSWVQFGNIENKKEVTPRDMYLKEEVEQLIELAEDTRDKAIICLLYYGGLRVGELLSLRIKDVIFDDEEARVTINVYGKTKERTIHIKEPYYLLKTYISPHKLKKYDNAPLWISKRKNTIGATNLNLWDYCIGVRQVESLTRTLMEESKLKKRGNPHNYRKSRATYLSTKMDPHTFNKFFGWTGAKQWETYVNLSQDVLKKEMKRFYGEEIKEDKPEIYDCKNCGLSNRSTLEKCERCDHPLTKSEISKGITSRSGKRNLNLILNKMFETPEFRKAMARLLLDEGFMKYVERIAKHEKELLESPLETK